MIWRTSICQQPQLQTSLITIFSNLPQIALESNIDCMVWAHKEIPSIVQKFGILITNMSFSSQIWYVFLTK